MNTDRPRDLIRPTLDEQAESYVWGLMSESEAKVFESLLAESQDAREAVAQATEILAAVEVAERTMHAEPTRPLKDSTWRRAAAAWLMLGTAAAALVFAGVNHSPRNQRGDERVTGRTPAAQDPALVEAVLADGFDWSAATPEDLVAADSASDLTVDDKLPLIADSPEWMLAAVILTQRDGMPHEREMETP